MSLSGGWAQMRRIDLGELEMSNMGRGRRWSKA